MTFSEIKISQKFEYDGIEYRKLPATQKPKYGWINAVKVNPSVNESYPGDTGYRHFYDDESVTLKSDYCPFADN